MSTLSTRTQQLHDVESRINLALVEICVKGYDDHTVNFIKIENVTV
jgi:hypothetical protein